MSGGATTDTKGLEALLSALNKSAERLQTLWFSFIGLTLYFIIIALTTTHMNLLLEEAQVLPIVNMKVPLLPFYVLAPIFYVVIHLYVLLMLVLLARSAKVFEDELRTSIKLDSERETFRMRLENALFLQILVGARPERGGVNGWFLATMALITVAVAPIVTLLVIQLQFLPYHHFEITWLHRAMVGADLTLVFLLWRGYRHRWGRSVPLGPVAALRLRSRSSGGRATVTVLAWVISFCSTAWLTLFEGRWYGEPTAGSAYFNQFRSDLLVGGDARFPDRLNVHGETVVGAKLYNNAEKERTSRSGGDAYVRTRDFRGRDFSGADFGEADLRGADFSGRTTILVGASFINTFFQNGRMNDAQASGANFSQARMSNANLSGATIQNARFEYAHLQNSTLTDSRLQGTNLTGAKLQGANLSGASAQSAVLTESLLMGARLKWASMHGVDLKRAKMQGADFIGSELKAADLSRVEAQGARFNMTQMQGANLTSAQIQGADLSGADISYSTVTNLHAWRTTITSLKAEGVDMKSIDISRMARRNLHLSEIDESLIVDFVRHYFRRNNIFASFLPGLSSSARLRHIYLTLGRRIFEGGAGFEPKPVTDADIATWSLAATREVQDVDRRKEVAARFEIMKGERPEVDTAIANFRTDQAGSAAKRFYDRASYVAHIAAALGDLACDTGSEFIEGQPHTARGLVRYRLAYLDDPSLAAVRNRLLTGRKDSTSCPGVKYFTGEDWVDLGNVRSR